MKRGGIIWCPGSAMKRDIDAEYAGDGSLRTWGRAVRPLAPKRGRPRPQGRNPPGQSSLLDFADPSD